MAAGAYWLAYLPSSSNLAFKLDYSGTYRAWTFAYGPLPDTFTTSPSSGGVHWSFYATLNAIAEIVPAPVYAGPFNVTQEAAFYPADLVRSKTSRATGPAFFEVKVNTAVDTAKIGVGIDNNSESLTTEAGRAGAICWMGDGKVNYNGIIGAYSAPSFAAGDVLGIEADPSAKTVRFRVNGNAFSPYFSIGAIAGPMFAVVQLANRGDMVMANFTGPFSFAAPSMAWG